MTFFDVFVTLIIPLMIFFGLFIIFFFIGNGKRAESERDPLVSEQQMIQANYKANIK